ncbi:MAG: hypothetical protein ACRDTA_16430 [Pseudonocardiaceae bacterium]
MAKGKHEDNTDKDGNKDSYDHSNTKDADDSGSGKHEKGDTGDRDNK